MHRSLSPLSQAIRHALSITLIPSALMFSPVLSAKSIGPFVKFEPKNPIIWEAGANVNNPFQAKLEDYVPQLLNYKSQFIDIDGDNDQDIVFVKRYFKNEENDFYEYRMVVYENIGTAAAPIFQEAEYPELTDLFNSVEDKNWFHLADLDKDGDIDLFINHIIGNINHIIDNANYIIGNINQAKFYENTSGSEQFNFSPAVDVFSKTNSINDYSVIYDVDIDNDGDLEVAIRNHYEVTYEFDHYLFFEVSKHDNQFSFEEIDTELVDDAFKKLANYADLDQDGDTDYSYKNTAYINQGIGSDGKHQFETLIVPNELVRYDMPRYGESNGANQFIDIDGDNDLDLLTDNYIYQNQANLGVASFIKLPKVDNPLFGINTKHPYVFADLDADNDLDLIFSNSYFSNITNAYYPTFSFDEMISSENLESSSSWVHKIILGDIDKDGDLDKLEQYYSSDGGVDAWFWSNNIGNPAKISFSQQIKVHYNEKIFPLSFNDLDHDDDLDLITVNRSTGQLGWFENLGTRSNPQFYYNQYLPGTAVVRKFDDTKITSITEPSRVSVTDIDGDGDIDILLGHQTQTLSLFENIGNHENPIFAAENTEIPNLIALGTGTAYSQDFNGDNKPDILMTDNYGALNWYINNHEDKFSVIPKSYSRLQAIEHIIHNPNLCSKNKCPYISLIVNERAETIQNRKILSGDLDGDGIKELINILEIDNYEVEFLLYKNISNSVMPIYQLQSDALAILENTNMKFDFKSFALADIDNDGSDELIFVDKVDRKGAKLIFKLKQFNYSNANIEELNASNIPTGNYYTHYLQSTIADFDTDGDLDLLIFDESKKQALWLENTGNAQTPVFTLQEGEQNPFTELALNASPSLASDFDTDGDIDLLVGFNFFENQQESGKLKFTLHTGTDSPFYIAKQQFSNLDGQLYLNSHYQLLELDTDENAELFIEYNVLATDDEKKSLIQSFSFDIDTYQPVPSASALPAPDVYPLPIQVKLSCQSCNHLVYRIDDGEQQDYSDLLAIDRPLSLHYAPVNEAGEIERWFQADYYIDTGLPSVDIPGATASSYPVSVLSGIQGVASDAESGIQRVDIQIKFKDAEFYLDLQGDLDKSPFAKTHPAWIKAKLQVTTEGTIRDVIWTLGDLDGVKLPVGTYTARIRAVDYAGHISPVKEWTLQVVE